jgi:hypothetical protein
MTLSLRTVISLSLTVLTASAALSAAGAQASPPSSARAAAEVASTGPRAPRAPALLPNARALKASHLFVSTDGAGHRVLRYQSGLANVGAGPLEVRPNKARPCPASEQHASQVIYHDRDRNGRFSRARDTVTSRRSAGCMVYHAQHSHWHFEAAARFRLYRATQRQPIVVTGRKMSFCLRDSERAPDRWPTRDYREFYGACSRNAPQGISIGWVDIYQNFLPGQSMRLPDRLPNGVYCLRTTVDPRDELRETDDSDNGSLRAFALRGSRVVSRPTRLCT